MYQRFKQLILPAAASMLLAFSMTSVVEAACSCGDGSCGGPIPGGTSGNCVGTCEGYSWFCSNSCGCNPDLLTGLCDCM